MALPSHGMEHTDPHISAMALGLRCCGFPRSSHGVIELVARNRVASVHITATSDSGSTRYRGDALMRFEHSEMLVMERCLIRTVEDCAL